MKIIASYSRKINHDIHGGNKFESSDHFCSIEREFKDDLSKDEIDENIRRLEEWCRCKVDIACADEIQGLKGGISNIDFIKIYDKYVLDGSMESDQYAMMTFDQRNKIHDLMRSKKRIKNKTK